MIELVFKLGYTNHFIIESLGFASDFFLFGRQGHIDLEIVSHNSQAIHTKVRHRLEEYFITFAYVRPNLLAKCRF